MESQSWRSCFCSSQNGLPLLPFVIEKGWAGVSTKVHILWCTHSCLAIGWTQQDTNGPLAHFMLIHIFIERGGMIGHMWCTCRLLGELKKK